MFPTSNTSKDPFFFTYTAYANRGNNFSNLGPHQVHVKNNDSERAIQLVGWTFEKGYMQEDFTKKVIRPYLFNTARMCPASWGKGEPLIGAGVFKIQGTQQYFTLAFEDPFNGTKEGFKGFLMVGKNPQHAIKSLQNSQPKDLGWGKYYTEELNGRLRTVLELTELQLCK